MTPVGGAGCQGPGTDGPELPTSCQWANPEQVLYSVMYFLPVTRAMVE